MAGLSRQGSCEARGHRVSVLPKVPLQGNVKCHHVMESLLQSGSRMPRSATYCTAIRWTPGGMIAIRRGTFAGKCMAARPRACHLRGSPRLDRPLKRGQDAHAARFTVASSASLLSRSHDQTRLPRGGDSEEQGRSSMMKPIAEDGSEIDSNFIVELNSCGFDLIIESRGGSKGNRRKNPDYAPAMRTLLARMKARELVLQDVFVDSSVARKLQEADRRVLIDRFALPLPLSDVHDVDKLRLAIGRASAAFGRADGGRGGQGNGQKRMRLRMQCRLPDGMTSRAVEQMLSEPETLHEAVAPTVDPELLEARAAMVGERKGSAWSNGTAAPPVGQRSVFRSVDSVTRFCRDPQVVAWIRANAHGECEVCGRPAPFLKCDGNPYLEVHHVRPLADGGPDMIENAIACCANCHRELHDGRDRDRLRVQVIALIERLIDYPPTNRHGTEDAQDGARPDSTAQEKISAVSGGTFDSSQAKNGRRG